MPSRACCWQQPHLLETQIEIVPCDIQKLIPDNSMDNALPQLPYQTEPNSLGEIGWSAAPQHPYGPYVLRSADQPHDGS